MEQLINLKNRIKAVETIKKITHAMRLISMSNHSKLRVKRELLTNYSNELKRIASIINNLIQKNDKEEQLPEKTLIIIVASEKGLCGNFNSKLFHFIRKSSTINKNDDLITVGKQANVYAKIELQNKIVKNFDTFNSLNFIKISSDITNYILQKKYFKVIVFSNYQKTFFVQKSQQSNLLPVTSAPQEIPSTLDVQDYHWTQEPDEINDKLKNSMINVNLQEFLFESLLAEQAARFISMDNATRNAEQLINQMKLNYNKIRQAAITRELTELSSGT